MAVATDSQAHLGRRKKEEGRRKKEEGRRKKEEGRRKKEEGRRLLKMSNPVSAIYRVFPDSCHLSGYFFPHQTDKI
ncbi:hypothetical protein [Microcoleus vaginatus]|uniref:hypothetical protein n=1 Tax=Microcoleus vaginatus TaxID=119532 RepID=UPI0002E3631A